MFIVSEVGMFVYMLVISKETSVEMCGTCIFLILLIRSVVFLIYDVLFRGIRVLRILSICWAILYAGALV